MNPIKFHDADHGVFELLGWIRKRPQAYLDGDLSIRRLRSFLVGYECGLGQAHLRMPDQPLFLEFQNWLAPRLGFGEATSGWCKMILASVPNEETALELFFQLLEEFKKERGMQ